MMTRSKTAAAASSAPASPTRPTTTTAAAGAVTTDITPPTTNIAKQSDQGKSQATATEATITAAPAAPPADVLPPFSPLTDDHLSVVFSFLDRLSLEQLDHIEREEDMISDLCSLSETSVWLATEIGKHTTKLHLTDKGLELREEFPFLRQRELEALLRRRPNVEELIVEPLSFVAFLGKIMLGEKAAICQNLKRLSLRLDRDMYLLYYDSKRSTEKDEQSLEHEEDDAEKLAKKKEINIGMLQEVLRPFVVALAQDKFASLERLELT
jgi:hypothetical protein